MEAKEPKWKYTVLYIVIFLLLVGAIGWEAAATTQLSKRSSEYLKRATLNGTNSCDRVGLAMNLNEYENDLVGVQWRRGLICSIAILILLPVVSRVILSPTQTVATGLLIWVAFTSIAGFSDYHMRQNSSNVVTSCLSLSLTKISDSANTGPGSGTCSADVWAPY